MSTLKLDYMEILRPKDTRAKGLLTSIIILLIFLLIPIILDWNSLFIFILFLLMGIYFGYQAYFGNITIIPPGQHGIKYFWDEPQKNLILTEGSHRTIPFFEKITIESVMIQSANFELPNIRGTNHEPLTFNIIVQYSIDDVHVTLYKSENNRFIKMRKIMTNTLNIEIQQNNISDLMVLENQGILTTQLKNNLYSHMQLHWGCLIDSVSIISIIHGNSIRHNDIANNNSLELQIGRVRRIAEELHCSPEDAFKIDLIRTGRINHNQNTNIYQFPDAVNVIQAVSQLINSN